MDLKRLPRLPLLFFYRGFPPRIQGFFWGMMGLIGLAAIGLYFNHAQPYFWSLDVSTVPQTFTEEVTAQTLRHGYREIDLKLNAFRQWATFSAGPITLSPAPFYAFLLFQFVGWSMFLAAASLIRSRWAYLFYGFFSLFFHFSGIADILYPGDIYHVLEFLMLISYLGLAYVFQMYMIRWGLMGRFLSILGLSALYGGIAVGIGGWPAVHLISVDTFSYLAFVSILLLLFVGKEPTNLLFYFGTNHPDPKRRLSRPILLSIYAVLLVIELVWLDEFMDFGVLGDFKLPFRPTHLLIISALWVVFTSQNHFTKLRNVFSTHTAFTFLLLSWVLVVLSFLMVQYSVGDPFFLYLVERLATVAFLGVGFAHMIYVFSNFGPLIQRRFHVYYLLTQGARFSFMVVWMIGLISLTMAEGQDSWKSFTLLWHAQACHDADQALLTEQPDAAVLAYERALAAGPRSPKANYNLASLLLANPNRLDEAVRLYQTASRRQDFPYGLLNAAQLLRLSAQENKALALLETAAKRSDPHPYVLNNLGILYQQSQQADSAIRCFQQALLQQLNNADLYANLAQVYWDNERISDARSFFEAALDNPVVPSSVYTNVMAFQLAQQEAWEGDWSDIPTEDYFTAYNQQLLQLRDQPEQLQAAQVKALSREENAPDAVLLDGYLMFLTDSIDYAVSRIEFLNQAYPSYAAQGNMLLGSAYFSRGVPEMAFEYFFAAGQAGNPKGTLQAGKMLIDLGQADSANYLLSGLRAEHEELWEPCAKELAMLLAAYGQEIYAMTEWDLADLSRDEQIRIGLYADSLQQFSIALESFRRIQEANPTSLLPYLEMGRLYNKYRIPYAVDDLAVGLQQDSSSLLLKIEYARALLYADRLPEAQQVSLPDSAAGEEQTELKMLQAELALAVEDTSAAIEFLKEIQEEKVLDQRSKLLLAKLYRAQKIYDQGSLLISQALDLNDRQAEYWYYYAAFYRELNLKEDAGFGAIKAIELSPSPLRQKEIAKEFAAEIRLVAE